MAKKELNNQRHPFRLEQDDYGLNHSEFRESLLGKEFLGSASLATIASFVACGAVMLFYALTPEPDISAYTSASVEADASLASPARRNAPVSSGKVYPPEPAVIIPKFEAVAAAEPALSRADNVQEMGQAKSDEVPQVASVIVAAREGPVIAEQPAIRARIAIVIDDLGMNRAMNRRIAAAKGPFNLSYLPYAPRLREQTREARLGGHELLVHLPMEPDQNEMDPGPNALLTTQSHNEIMQKLQWNLEQFSDFVGVNNHMGSRFTENSGLMRPVLEELNRRGLYFLDSRTSSQTKGVGLAIEIGMAWSDRDIFLDNERTEDAIRAQLTALERVAIRRGEAIAIGHPYGVTLDVLEEWSQTLASKGIQLVPLSQLIHKPDAITVAAQKAPVITRNEPVGVGQE